MNAIYEKLEEFVKAASKEENPMYVCITRTQDENNNIRFQINLQVIAKNNNLVLTHIYSELPGIKAIVPESFDVLLGSGDNSVIAKKRYEEKFLEITNAVAAEKEKIMLKMKELGFTAFEDAYIR